MTQKNDAYNNWFVIQVTTNREYIIRDFIYKHSRKKVLMHIFSREFLFERQKKTFCVTNLLFPGYIFIHKDARYAIDIIKKNKKSEFIRPVCLKTKKCSSCFNSRSPCMIRPYEMEYLLNNSDQCGIFRLSKGYQRNDSVVVTEGPLKNIYGDILWINNKKKKACVEIELFNRKIKVNLGINVLKEEEAVSLI
jgi:transcription antitermination factor NusG